jgi:proline dehydrogenase
MRAGFVRRAVSRFMPGETLDDALEAARALARRRIPAVLTCLGENVTSREEAAAVARHYLEALDRIREAGLDAEISVKLTQLGLDLGPDLAASHVEALAARAGRGGARLWIDMEDGAYTDATLALYRALRPGHPGLGVCVQAYLYRTRDDLETLIRLGAGVRLVKGAYREPPERAYPRKRDVDANYLALAKRLLGAEARAAGVFAVLGTHDPALIDSILSHAEASAVPAAAYEFDLLYGIRRDVQERLTLEGRRLRILISYGAYWFPWYMRRLAERPANLLFVLRSLAAG